VSYLGPPDLPFPSGHGESSRYASVFSGSADGGVESSYMSENSNAGTHFCVWNCFLACTRLPDRRPYDGRRSNTKNQNWMSGTASQIKTYYHDRVWEDEKDLDLTTEDGMTNVGVTEGSKRLTYTGRMPHHTCGCVLNSPHNRTFGARTVNV
jgi:hypothetical protein